MKFYFFLFSIVVLSACTRQPDLKGFNKSAWTKELMGCGENRIDLVSQIMTQREKLIGLQQPAIIKILGTPDEHELYKRNQKFFKYYTTCANENSSEASYLQVRFNALGQSIAVDHYK